MASRTLLLALCVVLVAFISNARHLPHRHANSQRLSPVLDGRNHKHAGSGRVGHSRVDYAYTAQRSQRVIYQLDDLSHELIEWECKPGALTLHFRSKEFDFEPSIGSVVTGTSAWTCGQPLGGTISY